MKIKTNDNFMAKFGSRAELIGKDGILGIMRNTGFPINNNNFNSQKIINNRNYKKNLLSQAEIILMRKK